MAQIQTPRLRFIEIQIKYGQLAIYYVTRSSSKTSGIIPQKIKRLIQAKIWHAGSGYYLKQIVEHGRPAFTSN